ncbi:MAG: YceI family protein [Gemmatimonadota bacterium]
MLVTLVLAGALFAPNPAPLTDPVTWEIDPVHSEITFRVRHFVTKVPGTFLQWNGTITADPGKLSDGAVEVVIQTASISTKNERRDAHLRSPDFFAADSFPTITFKSTTMDVTGSTIKLSGDLTIRGVTKPVVLTGEFGGVSGPPEPKKQRIGFSASTKVNRIDYGVKWNRALEGGGFMLSDEVDITINVEAVRQ